MFCHFLLLFFCVQVLEDGRPFLDMAHIITNLNRLDAGIPDTVSHWLVFPAKLSDWLTFLLTPASQTRSVIGWFFPPSFLMPSFLIG
jgi:hypothetical protein